MKTKALIIVDAYLRHSSIASYLSKDGRYDVVAVEMSDAYQSYIDERPPLTIIEWNSLSDNQVYKHIASKCKEFETGALAVLPKKDLQKYIDESIVCDFVLLPLNDLEFRVRAAMAIERRPSPVAPNMTYIDDHLAINFDACVARKGRNEYISFRTLDVIFLKYLFEHINRWVYMDDIEKTVLYTNASSRSATDRMNRLRNLLEDDPKNPRYLKSSGKGHYMLYSEAYPPGDPLLGFKIMKCQ